MKIKNRAPVHFCAPSLFLTLVMAFVLLLPRPAQAAFSLDSSDANLLKIDTGAGLVFKVRRTDNGSSTQSAGDIASLLYNGVEYQDQSRGSQVNGGFDYLYNSTSAVTVDAAVVDANTIKVTVQAGNLTHYYIARKGVANIYMGTYFSTEPDTLGLCRYILRIQRGKLTNGPIPSDIKDTDTTVESGDIFGFSSGALAGQTRSKHYSNQRLIDWNYIGATGTNVGAWVVRDNNEGNSGGPFYRSLLNQGTDTDQEITYIVNYGEAQTEAFRTGILNSYTLVFTNGAAPTTPVDTTFFGNAGMNLTGYVAPADRGKVTGVGIKGRDTNFAYTVGFANANAQYFALARASDGFYSVAGMLPGTYAMTIYKGELAVYTSSVTITAGGLVQRNTITLTDDPSFVPSLWRIGDWDGSPREFLNGDKVTTMHPSDVRMSPWAPGAFVVGTSSAATGFPCYGWKDVNNGQVVKFNLNASQISNLTLRIGLTTSYAGARPKISLNTYNSGNPSASSQPNTRTLTVGTYRGNNVVYTFNIPASALVVGENTLSITAISGSGSTGFLSAGYSFDAIDLSLPPSSAYWNGSLSTYWNTTSAPDASPNTNFDAFPTSGINLQQLPGSATDVYFAAQNATNLSTTLGQNFDVRGVTTLSGTTALVGIGGGNQLALEAGGLTAQAGSGGLSVYTPILLNQNQTWTGAATTPVTATGVVSGSAALTTAGSVTLSGANTYSGGTTVSSGTLQVGNNTALGSGFLAVQGGSVDLNGRALSVGPFSGVAGASVSNQSTNAATLNTNSGGNDTTFAGDILNGTAAVALTKTGAGTLTLNGNNLFSGLTSVQAGVLNVAGGTLGTASPNLSTSHIEIAPASGSAADVVFSAGTLNRARVIVGGNVGNTTGGTATLTQNGGTLNSAQWLSIGSVGTGAFTMNGGVANVNSASGTQLEVGTFGAGSGTVNIGAGSQLNLLNNANLAMGVINGGSGSGVVNQNGGAVTFYSDAGTSAGGTGGLRLGLGTGRTGTYTFNLNGGTLTTPVVSRTSGTGTFNFNGGVLKPTASTANFMAGLSSAFVKSGGALIDTNGQNISVAQPLLSDATSSGGGLTKSGVGTLTLGGQNSYSGATTVNAGTLALGASNVVADLSNLVLNGATFSTGGNSDTLGALSVSGASTLDVGNGNSVLKFSGAGTFGGTLSIQGYTSADQVFIGTSAALTGAQLAQIKFINPGTTTGTVAAAQLASGEIVPATSTSTSASGVVISEFRFGGPNGAMDEFIELLNTSNSPISLSGWTLAPGTITSALSGLDISTKTIPALGHLLLINSGGYSLGSVAAGDVSFAGDIAFGSPLTLKNAGGAAVDFVGNLTTIASPSSATNQYAFVRRLESGVPADSGNDALDFNLVDTGATASTTGATGVGAMTAARLGAPGPQNVSSPIQRNSQVTLLPINAATVGTPTEGRYASKNSALDSPNGRLTLRRTLTNNTGATVTVMRFRVVAMTGGTTTASGVADLRALTSAGVTVNGTKVVQGMALDAPSTPTVAPSGFGANPASTGNGGGLNSSWSVVALPSGGLLNGQTINVEFLFGIVQNGTYRVVVDTELLP